MAEIIKIELDMVVVGLDDGSVVRVNLDDVNFIPEIGDKVKLFNDGNNYFIKKLEKEDIYQNDNLYKNSSYEVDDNIYNPYKTKGNDTKKSDNVLNVTNNYYLDKNTKEKKKVNKIAYTLLSLFLGGIGAHKFYCGKIGKGLLYLLFSPTGIPSLIGLIEFLIALTKTSDENGNIYV